MPCSIPDGARQQLLGGSWDATAVLLEAGDAIEDDGKQAAVHERVTLPEPRQAG